MDENTRDGIEISLNRVSLEPGEQEYSKLFNKWQQATAEESPEQTVADCSVALLDRLILASIGYEEFIIAHSDALGQPPQQLIREVRAIQSQLRDLKRLVVTELSDAQLYWSHTIKQLNGRRRDVDIPVSLTTPFSGIQADVITLISVLYEGGQSGDLMRFESTDWKAEAEHTIRMAKTVAFNVYRKAYAAHPPRAEDYGLWVFVNDYISQPHLPPLRDRSFQLGLTFAILMALEGVELNKKIAFTGMLKNTRGDIGEVDHVIEKAYEVSMRGYHHLIVPKANEPDAIHGRDKAVSEVGKVPLRIHALETLNPTRRKNETLLQSLLF